MKNPMALVYGGGSVQRMHTRLTIKPQTVAEHSYGVAWWCWVLTDGKPSVNLLMAALAHDLPEVETGDMPSHTKRQLVDPAALDEFEAKLYEDHGIPVFPLTEDEQKVLKLADYADLLAYCCREKAMGNHSPSMRQMHNNICKMIRVSYNREKIHYIERVLSTIYGVGL